MSTHHQNPGVQHHHQQHTVQRPSGKASYFGIAASILVLLGSFLPWSEVTVDGVTETVKATEGDGLLTIGASIVALLLFAVGAAMRKPIVSACAALPSLVALVLVGMNVADPERLPKAYIENEGGLSSEEVEAFIGQLDISTMPGVWIAVLGAVVAVACGAWAGMAAKRAA